MSTQKSFSAFIIVVVILIVGAYYLGSKKVSLEPNVYTLPTASPSQNPDAVSTWKTYSDDIHGFSFKYPSDWIELKRESNPLHSGKEFIKSGVGPTRVGVGVTIYEDSSNLTAKQFLDQIFYKDYTETPDLKDAYLKNTKYEQVLVGGKTASKFVITTPPGPIGTGVWITQRNFAILLRFFPVEGEEELINPILSTFTFTN